MHWEIYIDYQLLGFGSSCLCIFCTQAVRPTQRWLFLTLPVDDDDGDDDTDDDDDDDDKCHDDDDDVGLSEADSLAGVEPYYDDDDDD